MASDETQRAVSPESSGYSPHIRLRVELVVEIADASALTRAALDRVEDDGLIPDEERAHAREIIASDAGEAIAHLVDPFDLVRELPGVELAHASWGSEEVGGTDIGALASFDDLDEDLDDELRDDLRGASR
jgi:hypothetical protein